MTIKELIEKNRIKNDGDIERIVVSVRNRKDVTPIGNPKEIYFGELSDVPETYMDMEIKRISPIVISIDEKWRGVHVIEVETEPEILIKEASSTAEYGAPTVTPKEKKVPSSRAPKL